MLQFDKNQPTTLKIGITTTSPHLKNTYQIGNLFSI